MPLDFPTSPLVGDVYTEGLRSWQWNGRYWQGVTVSVGFAGSIGYTGSKGGGDIKFLAGGVQLTDNLKELRIVGTGYLATATSDVVTLSLSGGGGGGGGGSPNLDGGLPDSFYGGIAPIDAGGVT